MLCVVLAALHLSFALPGQGKQDAQAPEVLLKEAVSLHQAGKLDEAIRDYYLFLDGYPNAPEVRSNLGAALAGVGRYAEAIEQYKFALAEKSDPRLRLNLALAYYKVADFRTAADELEKVRDADPTNLQAAELLADCNLKLGQNKKTIDVLTPLHRADPNDMGIAYLLGTALVRDGQLGEAQLVIDAIFRRGESAEAHLLMGTAKFEAHEFKGALEELKRAIDLNPNLPGVSAYYGMALLVMGDTAGARAAFEKELAHDPNNFEANLRLGALLRIDQDYKSALRYIQRAQKLRPGDPGVRYQMASILLADGREEQARTQLEALIKDSPTFTEAHVTLATIYFREKRNGDGERERAVVKKLIQDQQANAPAARAEK